MRFSHFLIAYSLGTIFYVLIITYAGSISSLDKLTPAIFTDITVSIVLWLSWYFLGKKLSIEKSTKP